MGTFSKTVPFEIEFDGDKITMDLERFTRKDMITLEPFMDKDNKDGSTQMKFGDVLQMMEACSPILLERIKNFNGCKNSSGEKLELADIIDENYYVNLFAAIFQKFMEVSFMGADEVKKPEGTSEESLTSEEVTDQPSQ